MPDSDPQKGQIPLVVSSSGSRLRVLLDSKRWRQTIAKPSSTVAGPSSSRTTTHPSSSRTATGPPPSRSAPSSMLRHAATATPAMYENETYDGNEPMPLQGRLESSRGAQSTSRQVSRQSDNPSSSSRPVHPAPASSLPPANFQAQKRLRDWPEDSGKSIRRRLLPPFNISAAESADAQLARRYQLLEQVPDRFRHLFNEDGNTQNSDVRSERIGSYFRNARPASVARTPQVIIRNPSTSHAVHSRPSTSTTPITRPSGSTSQIPSSSHSHSQHHNRSSELRRPSNTRTPLSTYSRGSNHHPSTSGPQRQPLSRSAPIAEYEQQLPRTHESRPQSRPRRVITRYRNGGGSQVWMTQSEEEEDMELRPWVYEDDEVLSRHYEYPDEEDATRLTQHDGESYVDDVNMYRDDQDYEYVPEGDGMGPYGDGTVDPREFL